MIDWIADNSGTAGLLFFFVVFGIVVVWAMLPSNKDKLEAHKFIPLDNDNQEKSS